jgi:hypothetical protein
VNTLAKRGLVAAVSSIVLGGCAGMGANNANRDAGTSASSAATAPAVSFAQADLNGDARITPQEFRVWLRQSAGASSAQAAAGGTSDDSAFYAADSNLNGVLTLDEWQAMMVSPANVGLGAAPAPAPSRSPRP